jgi:DNA helicase II / ATP-dependent DNA helicase PcrA
MTIVLEPSEPNNGPRSQAPGPGGPGPGAAGFGARLTAGLNPQQKEAVEYRGQSLLIVAGAGSGKTSVLTRRIAGLIDSREAWQSRSPIRQQPRCASASLR